MEMVRKNNRKEKATAGVYSAGYNLGDALDIAADVYHGVSCHSPLNWATTVSNNVSVRFLVYPH